MAPRDLPKATPKVQHTLATKTNTTRKPPILSVTASTIKKAMSSRKTTDNKTPLKVKNTTVETRQRTNTVPKVATPKPKDNKSVPLPGSVTKSAKKSWKRRPKPAHSGVPVPEKMKRLLEKQLQDSNCSLDL